MYTRRGFGERVRADDPGSGRRGYATGATTRVDRRATAFVAVVPTDRVGGAERTLRTMVRAAAREYPRGHVIVLSGGRTGTWDEIPEHVSIHYIDADRELWGAPKALGRLRALAQSQRVMLTLTSHTHCNALLGLAKRLGWLPEAQQIFREARVTRLQYSAWGQVAVRQYYRFYPAGTLVICQTELMRESLREFVPRSARWRLIVVPNPVDVEELRRKAGAYTVPEALAGTPYIVVLGRLVRVKGHDILLQGFAEFRRVMPGWRLVVVGSGPLEGEVRSLADHLRLSDAVVFTGRQDNPYPYLSSAALGVVASRVEGFPNVLLEKMALCPRVASTICAGGVERLPGIFGCPPDNAMALATAMLRAARESGAEQVRAMRAEVARRTPTSYWETIKQHAGLLRAPGGGDEDGAQASDPELRPARGVSVRGGDGA